MRQKRVACKSSSSNVWAIYSGADSNSGLKVAQKKNTTTKNTDNKNEQVKLRWKTITDLNNQNTTTKQIPSIPGEESETAYPYTVTVGDTTVRLRFNNDNDLTLLLANAFSTMLG